MMLQGKGVTAKRGAGFCFRAVHQRGMAATGRDVWCGSLASFLARSTGVCFSPDRVGEADIPQPPLGGQKRKWAPVQDFGLCTVVKFSDNTVIG